MPELLQVERGYRDGQDGEDQPGKAEGVEAAADSAAAIGAARLAARSKARPEEELDQEPPQEAHHPKADRDRRPQQREADVEAGSLLAEVATLVVAAVSPEGCPSVGPQQERLVSEPHQAPEPQPESVPQQVTEPQQVAEPQAEQIDAAFSESEVPSADASESEELRDEPRKHVDPNRPEALQVQERGGLEVEEEDEDRVPVEE